ncbi:DUF3617 domain-containing protein [Denitromonas iodatirespirans]|uniref:DUF3617 family protein n=1 Tax=Denitromonas iodatirespirans TaxID=2795389 RepID=A0A944D8Y5_DENI1|nr:DUF3617 family protein [Denitromonas iodatirespirans]MBT0962144.1 DUF3617 family protein [Denitromonas iodatirespirans]
MRHLICHAALLVLVGTPALANTDIPKRKPGLWEHAMQMDQLPGLTHRAQVCVGENLDDLARHEAAGRCDKTDIRRDGDRVLIESVCHAEGSKVTTRGSFSGNFDSRYAGQLTSTFEPPMNGLRSSQVRMEAKWLGPCRPGQKPGDTILPDMPQGMGGIDLNKMMQNLPKLPGR